MRTAIRCLDIPAGAVLVAVLLAAVISPGAPAQARSVRPSFVVIDVDDLDERSLSLMPEIQASLVAEGVTFGESFVSTPMCCPSRASLLRGQYAHNHGVLTNKGEHGGFPRFRALGLEESTVATWLQAAGYRTGLVGKYLNEYSLRTAGTYIPPGWEHWFVKAAGGTYYGYTMNDGGRRVRFGEAPQDYRTDVEAGRLLELVRLSAVDDRPFFLVWTPVAPHTTGRRGSGPQPPTPAPRHEGAFDGLRAPNVCAFNERDMGDKPGFLRNQPALTAADRREIDAHYRGRLESMLAVDEAVGTLIRELQALGKLDSTYVIFTSDNGFHQGEHRIGSGKETPYEESLRVPLVVRGPDVPRGRVSSATALNLDIAPTLAELADARAPDFVDGRSLVPALRSPGRVQKDWRRGFLAQVWAPRDGATVFRAVRTTDSKVVRWISQEMERYDLASDPYEMDSLPALGGTTDQAELFAELERALESLGGCAGADCRRLDARLPRPRTAFVRVLSQNGNETLRPGERLDIRWSAVGVDRVRIELLRDARLFHVISDGTRGDGGFRWRVPPDLPGDGRYKIRIRDLAPGAPRAKDSADAAAHVKKRR